MNIVHYCMSSGRGGLEIYPVRLASGQRDRGHEVCVVSSQGSFMSRIASERALSVKTERGGLLHLLRLYLFLRKTRPDIVHVHRSGDIFAPALLRYLKGFRYRLIWMVQMASSYNKKDPYHWIFYRKIDAVIAISRFVRKKLLGSCPLKPGIVRTEYYGVHLPDYRKDVSVRLKRRLALGIRPGQTAVCQVSRVEEGKGLGRLFEAARRVLSVNPSVKFFVAGEATDEKGEKFMQSLKRKIHDAGLKESFIMTGRIEDIAGLWQAMDIGVLCSVREAFGLALIESMAAGKPVIGSDSGGIREIVSHNINGYLVNPYDPEEISRRILEITEDHELMQRFGKASLRLAEERFSFESYIDRSERVYGDPR